VPDTEKHSLGRRTAIGVLALGAGVLLVVLAGHPGMGSSLEFDVVSVKAYQKTTPKQRSLSPNGLDYSGITLFECIQAAYGVAEYQITGPQTPLLVSDQFTIRARSAKSPSKSEMMLMFQSLLSTRFGLKLHREKKELPVCALIVNKGGHKLTPATGEGESTMKIGLNSVTFKRSSTAQLAEFLAGLEVVNRPVLDRTGLGGAFDFTLRLSTNQSEPTLGNEHAIYVWDSIFHDILQLGLKLERTKGLVEFIVVDDAQRPTEN